MGKFSAAKQIVLAYYDALDKAAPEEIKSVLQKHMGDDYDFKCSYPFRGLSGFTEIAETFWMPLKTSLTSMERRKDIFIAGDNEITPGETWVMSMGHFSGLFDQDFLGIRHTRKMANIRYAEFSCVKDGKIIKTGLFIDLIGLMNQAGMYPLPPATGEFFCYPGPRNHNGLLYEDAPYEKAAQTLAVVDKMVDDLDKLNKSGSMEPPTPEELEASGWAKNMIWYGPCGIGAAYTTERYVAQHSGPFRRHLTDKVFNGHVVRFAEGDFACFFGWPNLSNRNSGGYLGLPEGNAAEMQVVDVYSLEDGKLSENWVIIDLPLWLKQQNLDVFKRTAEILNPGK